MSWIINLLTMKYFSLVAQWQHNLICSEPFKLNGLRRTAPRLQCIKEYRQPQCFSLQSVYRVRSLTAWLLDDFIQNSGWKVPVMFCGWTLPFCSLVIRNFTFTWFLLLSFAIEVTFLSTVYLLNINSPSL